MHFLCHGFRWMNRRLVGGCIQRSHCRGARDFRRCLTGGHFGPV